MSYLERILEPGEQVRYVGRLHWLIYSPAITLLICGAVLLIAAAVYSDEVSYLVAGGLIALLLSLLAFIPELLRRRTTEIAVTDRRVIFKTGILRRRSMEMNMQEVESVDVDQNILGRIFEFGTVLVRGTGASLEPLNNVENPLKLRSQITAR
jgi:uncharacterized membrane protein YdbT with pleckstrin-like domain